MFYLKRLIPLFRRSLSAPRFSNISFLPVSEDVHPVFKTHYQHLQDKTAWPFPGKVLHVINRLPKLYSKFNYIAEVEGLHSLLDKTVTRANDFSPLATLPLIERELDCGKLRRIVFQSQSAFEMHRKWMTPKIEAASSVVRLVPVELFKRTPVSQGELRLLVVGTANFRKGLFMLRHIVPKVRAVRPDIRFTCVTSVEIPMLNDIEGLDMVLIKRMPENYRKQIFMSHHYLINLSIGDTLGTFIDSCQYNIPLVGFPGQHGQSYVPRGCGILLTPPLFEYADPEWDRKWSIRTFPDYIENQYHAGFFNETIEQTTKILSELTLGNSYADMCRNQYDFSLTQLTVQGWLDEWESVYRDFCN